MSQWPQTCNYCGAPLMGANCPRCGYERKREGSVVFSGYTSSSAGGVLTLLGYAMGDEDGSSGPTSLAIPSLSLSTGDLLIVGCGIDSGGSAIEGATLNGVAIAAHTYQEGASVGVRSYHHEATAAVTGDLVVSFNQPVHSGVIIAAKLSASTYQNSGEETPASAATTVSKSQPNLTSANGIYLAFVATLGPPSDTVGTWSDGYAQVERQGTTTGIVSNLTLTLAWNNTVPPGAHTVTYSGFTSREPGMAVVHAGA